MELRLGKRVGAGSDVIADDHLRRLGHRTQPHQAEAQRRESMRVARQPAVLARGRQRAMQAAGAAPTQWNIPGG